VGLNVDFAVSAHRRRFFVASNMLGSPTGFGRGKGSERGGGGTSLSRTDRSAFEVPYVDDPLLAKDFSRF
jgi:hypothetical protein